MTSLVAIRPEIDDMGISPEAFRVYFSIVCHIDRWEQFPSIQEITARCFNKRYALGRTHTDMALKELVTRGLVKRDGEDYSLTQPDEWAVEAV